MKYLLDTCIISYFLKKYPKVIEILQTHSPKDIAVSAITIHEIEYGLKLHPEKEPKIRHIWQELLDQINVLDVNNIVAIESAHLRSYLKTRGIMIGNYDLLISATARAYNMICVTSNIDEFTRVPELVIENWNE